MRLLLNQTKSKLISPIRYYYAVKRTPPKQEDEQFLAKHIYQKIKAKGPITVADYMREVLTNPSAGYYMNKDMFGEKGDFITSPEITQMFGEMLAVWLLNEWQKIGAPKPMQIIELGPGRGTLSADIIKIFSHFKSLHKVSLNLIEVSPYLSAMQARKLCIQSSNNPDISSPTYKEGTSHDGIPVRWYKQLSDVPKGFSLIIAHEFFDALPIHKFHKNYTDYREILIDIDEEKATKELPQFRYILARQDTPMSKVLLNKNEKRNHVEISPDCLLIYKQLCSRIAEDGGIALICDYGHDGTGTDTFRAFKKHQQVNPLELPGTADLTADVDFNLIKQIAKEVGGVLTYGPATQRDFLLKTGLEYRFKSLESSIKDPKHLENLTACYNFLVDSDKMGERFKFFSIFPGTVATFLNKFPVVGFS